MNPVVEVLRAIVDRETQVYSYKEDFKKLWSIDSRLSGAILVVFDGVPESKAEQSGLNLSDRVTAFDWIAWLALRDSHLSVMLLDLASHRHPGSFAVQTLPLLLPDMPWVRLYRVFGGPGEAQILHLLDKFNDELGGLAARLGRDGFGLDRLLADLNTGPSAGIPLPLDGTSEPVKLQIKDLWGQAITRAHGRHEVANLIGPMILAKAMADSNDRGARVLLEELKQDVLVEAFHTFLSMLGMLGGLSRWSDVPEEKPVFERDGHFPLGDAFERFKKVRFMLVDDQARIGYARLVSVMLTGEAGKPWPATEPAWEHQRGPVLMRARTNPDQLLKLLDEAVNAESKKLHVLGKDSFDVLLLDLRLMPDSGAAHPSPEEVRFLEKLISIYDRLHTTGNWTKRAYEAAKGRLAGDLDHPLQWALLPLLLCEVDPSLPIVIFSSTHQRDIIQALRTKPNVVTSFAKPLISGYGETSLHQVREDLSNALKHALQLHEKRAVWERFAELENWGRFPIYRIKSGHEVELFNRPPGPTWEPRIRNTELQRRLAYYFREYILWERYVETLSAPFELLEAALIPQKYLDDSGADNIGIWVLFAINKRENPDEGDPEQFSLVRALQLIRHKKAHGHALHEGMTSWEAWDDKSRLTAVILLFLGDYIEQKALVEIGDPGPVKFGLWDEYCLKIAWKLCQFDHVRSCAELHPRHLTADSQVPWQDVTAYTLALGCREVARRYQVVKTSWTALERLIRNRLASTGTDLRVGRILSDPSKPPLILEERDGTRFERFLRPMQETAPLKEGDWIACSLDTEDERSLSERCLPKSLYISGNLPDPKKPPKERIDKKNRKGRAATASTSSPA